MLFWQNDQTGATGFSTREQMLRYIKANGTGAVRCPDRDGGRGQWVHVICSGLTAYVQTVADGRWSDNLLALPLA